MRRLIIIAFVLAFLFLAGYTAWQLCELPPVRLLVRYGLTPACAPTGMTTTIKGVEFVEIGPGIFRMGSKRYAEGGDWVGRLCEPLGLPWGERPKRSNEMPVRWVEFRNGFWIARTEVTNRQYERYNEKHKRHPSCPGKKHPVVGLRRDDAQDYCQWLATISKDPVRLSTEAEWECACRAGSDGEFCFGDDEEELLEYAWTFENSNLQPREVATKRPNAWGLFDMHGNVSEWCQDEYHPDYEGAPADGSAWIEGGESWKCAIRGGSAWGKAASCRSAYRFSWPPTGGPTRGFRPAFVLTGEK